VLLPYLQCSINDTKCSACLLGNFALDGGADGEMPMYSSLNSPQARQSRAANPHRPVGARRPACRAVGRLGYQELLLIEKKADGTVRCRSVGPVAFVPMKPALR
jgi:hypothetical protein